MAEDSKGTRPRPGGHRLRQEVVAHHQRERILAGAVRVIAERGYRSVSVADIVKSAGIARARFYDNFASKEDCFFALYDGAVESTLSAVSIGCETADGTFQERVALAIDALLAHLAADLPTARAVVVEGPAVGPAITERFDSLIRDFAARLRAGRPETTLAEMPETVEETVIGGLYWLLFYALLENKPKRIEKLHPQLTEFALIPFIGVEAARVATTR